MNQTDTTYISAVNICDIYHDPMKLARSLPFIVNPISSVISHLNKDQFISNDLLTCMPPQYVLNSYLNDNKIPRLLSESNCFMSINYPDFVRLYVEDNVDKYGLKTRGVPYHYLMLICDPDEIATNSTTLRKHIRLVKDKYPEVYICVYGVTTTPVVYTSLSTAGADAVVLGVDDSELSNISTSTGLTSHSQSNNLIDLVKACRAEKDLLLLNTKIMTYSTSFTNPIDLLYAGADYILLSDIFFDCIETSGQKYIPKDYIYDDDILKILVKNKTNLDNPEYMYDLYLPISQKTAEQIFKLDNSKTQNKQLIYVEHYHRLTHKQSKLYSTLNMDLKPELGITNIYPVVSNISDKLENLKQYLKIAMMHTDSDSLRNFNSKDFNILNP